jgi:hypothetical protein
MPWPDPATKVTLQSAQSLAAGANLISTEQDQDAARYVFASFYLEFVAGTAPAADKFVELYILPKDPDGNYPDGGTSVDPNSIYYVDSFYTYADTSSHYEAIQHVTLPIGDFKVLIKSEVDQSLTVTLEMLRYNEPAAA